MVYLRDYDATYFSELKADTRGLLYFVKLVGNLAATNIVDVKSCFTAGKNAYPTFASVTEATVMQMKSTVLAYMERTLQPESATPIPNATTVMSIEEMLKYFVANSSDTLVITTSTRILNGEFAK